MKLTDEQYNIINSSGDIKINAVAGSGKTTTIIEYSKSRPSKSKFLYLAFNKSVKTEAEEKFAKLGIENVKVETAHSLAYKNIVFEYKYNLKPNGYKTHEVAKILKIRKRKEKHFELLIANHINRFVNYFCNSSAKKVNQLNYLDIVSDPLAYEFVSKYYGLIEMQTRTFLSKMDSKEIEITHDFYLKKFQLQNPVLNYDYILFDEGQDASPAMLDVFLKQKCTKIIVGDSHQQIYSWRYAVNSLEQVKFKTLPLSISFRFPQGIANLAFSILEWKNMLSKVDILKIKGTSSITTNNLTATIARTNLGLLGKAFEYVSENSKKHKLYFEGNINSYLYTEDGASLFDVLNLYNNNNEMIKDDLIKSFNDFSELEEYVIKTEDTQLSLLIEIVKKYKKELPKLIKLLRDSHVENKKDSEMILSTVHRSKGMEYETVFLQNDFLTYKKLKRIIEKKDEIPIDQAKLFEEINIIYVAVTRAIKNIFLYRNLLPEFYSHSPNIKFMISNNIENDNELKKKLYEFRKKEGAKSYSSKEARKDCTDAYKPWTKQDDEHLVKLVNSNISIKEIANVFGRTKGAILSRFNKIFSK